MVATKEDKLMMTSTPAFDEPSLAVDTHVERVSKRLGINRWKDNVTQVDNNICCFTTDSS
jgi:endonuclease III